MIAKAKSLVSGFINAVYAVAPHDAKLRDDTLISLLGGVADPNDDASQLEIFGALAQKLANIITREHMKDGSVKAEIKDMTERLVIFSKELDIAFNHADPEDIFLMLPRSVIADLVESRKGFIETVEKMAERHNDEDDNKESSKEYWAIKGFLNELRHIARDERIAPFNVHDFQDTDEHQSNVDMMLRFYNPTPPKPAGR